MEAKKREREEQHLYLTAKVITDTTFSDHEGFDLATFETMLVAPGNRAVKRERYAPQRRGTET